MQKLAKEFAEDNKLTSVSSRCSFDPVGGSIGFRLEFVKVDETAARKPITQEEVDNGLAKSGTILWGYDGEDWYLAKVLGTAPRCPKYIFEFLEFPEEGRYRGSFRNLKVRHPKTNQPSFV